MTLHCSLPGTDSIPRRGFLKSILVSAAAPLVLPAHVLGREGAVAPNSRIHLGVMGVGAQGTSDMLAFLAQPEIRVTRLCDVNRQNLERAQAAVRKAYGGDAVKEGTDFRELNADPSVDAVLMALPVHWHALAALDAVAHGKHLYHEKPIGLSFGEARLLREALRRQRTHFQFGTQQRSDQKFRWSCELARNGRLGKLREIQVSVPGGRTGPKFPEQPVPPHVDWNRWVGPAPETAFHSDKLQRDHHENMTRFSLGMISCWGIHHLDIAQWANDADATGPVAVEGEGDFPKEGDLDAILRWRVRFEYSGNRAPIVFVSDGTPGFEHGVKLVGDTAWVHVRRGALQASSESLLTDPQNQCGTMPVRLPVSVDHGRNLTESILKNQPTLSGIETAVRGDTLCQLALLAVRQNRRLRWDPHAETFPDDPSSTALLQPRAYRGEWRLPAS